MNGAAKGIIPIISIIHQSTLLFTQSHSFVKIKIYLNEYIDFNITSELMQESGQQFKLCKRICPCFYYRVFASDFRSAAISGFCRSFISNAASSPLVSAVGAGAGSGVVCLPE